MKRTAQIIGVAAAALLAAPLSAQSFNLDSDSSVAGVWFGPPTAVFAGAASQPGTWNAITGAVTTTMPLVGLNGAATGVTFTRSTAGGGDFATDNANTTRDFEKLLDDGHDLSITPGVPITYTFSGLQNGNYDVYTYAIAPDFPQTDLTNVTINGVTVTVGGAAMPTNAFAEGVTHAHHTVTVTAGTITITAVRGNPTSFGTINGFQIKLAAQPCLGDIDGNGAVNVNDLLSVITHWGACPPPCPPPCTGDIAPAGGNCTVNVDDLLAVITHWGPCP